MKIIGLTGGIGSGKSTVNQMLTALGAKILDADALYHQLLEPLNGAPSPLAQQIAKTFPFALQEDSTIDRPALAKHIFAKEDERKKLNAITHPIIQQKTAQIFHHWAQEGCTLALYDMPLLYELAFEKNMIGVIVVWVNAETQLKRLCLRSNISEQEAIKRIQSQIPLEEKKARATWLIDNNGTLERTQAQAQKLWRYLQGI
jgi:dephospho-CoA kinase